MTGTWVCATAVSRSFCRSLPGGRAAKQTREESMIMTDDVEDTKRDFLRGAALVGAASVALSAGTPAGPALAQMLETGVRDDSVLAKIRKEGVLRVGYAQTGPWFYK